MYNFLIVNPGDNPNEGRNKINYNFSLLTGATSGGTFTGDFLSLSGGTVTGNTNFSGNLSGATLFSGSTDLATIINNIASQYSGITGNFLSLSGGTVTGETSFTNGLSATTLFSGSTDLSDLFSTHDYYVTGVTFNVGNYQLNINQNNGSSYLTDLSILATDMTVTGGTYNINTGIVTFGNNSGGTFQVSGFTSGYTDFYLTGGSFSSGVLTLNQQNGSIPINIGNYLPLSGGTITGATIFNNGLTATTISATTYQNLPVTADTFVTGFTISSNTLSINQNNNKPTLPVTIPTVDISSIFSAVTFNIITSGAISASTYYNLPKDVFVTGGTYSGSAITFTNNTGGTFSVTGLTSNFTGGTVSGNTNFSSNISGATYFSGSTPLTTIIQNIASQYASSGGTVTTGNFLPLSGGTVTGNTIFTQGLTANTISASTYVGIRETGVTPSILFISSPGSEYILDVNTSRSVKINLSNGANLNLKLSGYTSGATGNLWLIQGSAGNSTLTLTGTSYANYVVNGGAGQISLSNSSNAIDIISYITDGVNVFWSTGFNYT
jgi:hypothetical protein